MENNEISMFMDAKLDIHGKRPESLKFKTWTKCVVTIEAIKCLPSFLRISLTRSPEMLEQGDEQQNQQDQSLLDEPHLSVSINVPGVSVSLTESRTKSHCYGLFWKQHRRDCFIYFAIESEASCRRHMKWIKKSIKNLELHRQVFLEQRRSSRGPGRCLGIDTEQKHQKKNSAASVCAAMTALGPLPQIPTGMDANNSYAWTPRRVSRVSEIYEEIFEQDSQQTAPSLSRRYSHTSIASGIYEEMKPLTAANFNVIDEEAVADITPPPLPPLPPPRKRINTFETESGLLGEIPRSNTNPESEMAKKKKYKNMLDSIFGGVARGKRAESVSESVACSVDELLRNEPDEAVYVNVNGANDEFLVSASAKRQRQKPTTICTQSKRNSFSSPDLSKINFLENFDEDASIDAILEISCTHSEDLGTSHSLDESSIQRIIGADQSLNPTERISRESLNISSQIPINFNFSACNTSTINLVGACGANRLQIVQNKNKILQEDFTGYCIMAPIADKKPDVPTIQSTLSSGYCTGTSDCVSTSSSATSSCTNSIEPNSIPWPGPIAAPVAESATSVAITEESAIYENMMCGGSLNSSSATCAALYENLLTVKAAQELATTVTELSPTPPAKMSTSTPTNGDAADTNVEEGFYQTPRKSIISVDDKVPSYYPNSCEVPKLRRCSQSPNKPLTPTSGVAVGDASVGLRQLVNAKLRRERNENYYISSPQKIIEQQRTQPAGSQKSKSNKAKKTAAHKISEHVYSVSHGNNIKPNNNNNSSNTEAALQAKLQRELLQLAVLQNIDFKFDDSNQTPEILTTVAVHAAEEESENCFQAASNATRQLLQKYATIARTTPTKTAIAGTTTPTTTTAATTQHHLQLSQQSNTQPSPKQDEAVAIVVSAAESSVKKFASLPRFKKIDFSPLKLKINNVLQRNQQQELS